MWKRGGLSVNGAVTGKARLFLTFFSIGAVTFGGGYAMIPLIQRDLCERKGWLEEKEMLDILAAAQSVPGAVAINTASLVGMRLAGVGGALAAMLGMVLPSFLVILLVAGVLYRFVHVELVGHAFAGMRAVVLGLLASVVLSVGRSTVKDAWSGLIAVGAVVCVVVLGVHPVLVLLGAGVLGLLASLWRTGRRSDG
ncbi:chromate transporter [Spirochaeta thermophila]|uniref:chromate transporter n=1 Tax=Winmispira thermophila TaxID=154 RepID=UPI001FE23EAC|nr:chromate transporter [Spirochaeta thermophila]